MSTGPHACCNKAIVKRGLWSPDEDEKLRNYITRHGHGCWTAVPKLAGLLRCGKSCRLRWINYLRPDLKRGNFTAQEALLIMEIHKIVGNKWAQIARYLPGRTDNEVKNFWNSSIKKKLLAHREQLVAAAAIQNNNNMLANAQMADPQMINQNIQMHHPQMNPAVQMHHPQFNPDFQTHPHFDQNFQMHPQMIIPNIQMHPQMNPDIQMHPQFNPNFQMHPEINPNIELHPQINPNIEMHSQINPNIEMHPQMNPNIQMHPQMNPNIQMHPQVDQNIQMHPQVDPNIQMYAQILDSNIQMHPQILDPNIQMHPQMDIIPNAPPLPPSPPFHEAMAYDYNVTAVNTPSPSVNVPPSNLDLPPYNAPLLDSQVLNLQEYGMDFMFDGDSGFGDIPPPSPELYMDDLPYPSPGVHAYEQDPSMHDSVMPGRGMEPINGLDFNGPPFSYDGQEQVLGFEPQLHINHISNIEALMTSFSPSGPSSSTSTFGDSTSAAILPPEPAMPFDGPFFEDLTVPSVWGPQP